MSMKKILLLVCLAMTTIAAHGQPRNLFVELGYAPAAVDAKLAEVFSDVFRGPNKVYFEVGDTLGYISDVKNNDVRTEGMSYGMMITVQLDQKDIFDRLWRWSKKYMQHHSGQREGYFAWSCKTDGTHNAEGAASDGELYYITALIFASNRWGNDTDINYKAEAQHILNSTMPREYTPEPRPGFPPITQHPTPKYSSFTLNITLSPSHPTASASASPTPATTFPPSTRCGRAGPTTDAQTCGATVPPRAASCCTRPPTPRRASTATCASTTARPCRAGEAGATAATTSVTTPGACP